MNARLKEPVKKPSSLPVCLFRELIAWAEVTAWPACSVCYTTQPLVNRLGRLLNSQEVGILMVESMYHYKDSNYKVGVLSHSDDSATKEGGRVEWSRHRNIES